MFEVKRPPSNNSTEKEDHERQKRWRAIKDEPVTICRVAHGRANGRNVTGTLEQLFAALCASPIPTKQKKSWTPGFAPCELIDDTPLLPYVDENGAAHHPKNLRNTNVRRITLGVADFETTVDGFVPTVEHIRAPLDQRKIAFVLKTSFSNGAPGKGPRFRVIFPLFRVCDVDTEDGAKEYVAAYHRLAVAWGWRHDLSCSNPARFYYDGYRDAAGSEPLCIFQTGGKP